jgi:hypothetical protein
MTPSGKHRIAFRHPRLNSTSVFGTDAVPRHGHRAGAHHRVQLTHGQSNRTSRLDITAHRLPLTHGKSLGLLDKAICGASCRVSVRRLDQPHSKAPPLRMVPEPRQRFRD